MNLNPTSLLLADDDHDDCLFFKEAMDELQLTSDLNIVNNGEQLMMLLQKTNELPSLLFLDLNMPRKNGFECLNEIKANKALKDLNVVIISTSFEKDIAKMLYDNGALCYIQKPIDFKKLKNLIYKAILFSKEVHLAKPSFEEFVLQS